MPPEPHQPKPAPNLQRDGWAISPPLLSREACADLVAQAERCHQHGAGRRDMLRQAWCAALAHSLRAQACLQAHLQDVQPLQCTYFCKNADCNWLVAMHQDLSIPVAEKSADPALRGWAQKDGQLFVQPPASLLARMLALRVHLDAVDQDNGALQVLSGSHLGHYANPAQARAACAEAWCVAEAGSVMLMRPLLWHASGKIAPGRQRRVLHFLFGPAEPGFGLRWAAL